MTSSSSSSEGIVAVSSSDDDVVRSNDASSDAGTGNTDTAAILAQMPLALRAQLVAVAKASSNPAPAAVVDEWSKKTQLGVDVLNAVFAAIPRVPSSSEIQSLNDGAREAEARVIASHNFEHVSRDVGLPSTSGDDDGDETVFPGIPEDVRVEIVCGDIRGTLVLKAGFKRQQERVLYKGSLITPSKFEADAGKGASKRWKSTCYVVRENGSKGSNVGDWMLKKNYHAAGTVIGGGKADVKKTALSALPATKKPEAKKKSAFEIELEYVLDDEGGIGESVTDFVHLMRKCSRSAERSLLLQVIRGTMQKRRLRELAAGKGLDTLQTWLGDAREKFESTLLVSILRTLKMIPVNFDALSRTSIGTAISKLKTYQVPAGQPEFDNKEMNDKVLRLSKSVKAQWKAQITEAHVTESEPVEAKVAPKKIEKPAPVAAPVVAVKELGDDDLFGNASKSAKVVAKVPIKVTTKVIERKSDAKLAASTSKPSQSVTDLLTNAKPVPKVHLPPPPAKPTTADAAEDGDSGGSKKRKRKSVTWAADDVLEQVRVFEKDIKQKDVFPDPSSEATDASGRKALASRDREVAAERRAAEKAHRRRLDEMRATTSWRAPAYVSIPKPPPEGRPGEVLELSYGIDSEERDRMLRREAEQPSVKYKRPEDIPDTPGEAPNEDDKLDLQNTPTFTMEFQEEEMSPPIQDNMYDITQQYAQPMHDQAAVPAIDFNALGQLLAQVQSSAAGFQQQQQQQQPYAQQYASQPVQYPGPPMHLQSAYQPQAPPRATTTALSGGAPVPVQAPIVANGKQFRGVCAYFNTPRGCNWGDKCGYLHEKGVTPQ
jgi:protein phosphatase 1 regulatory subunit 10|uniref:C3H1-type domain-containing protein n=1 Tax=Ostreococcus mediterraneus TaxID=1486918 RepID=A0A7S0Z9A7_9CHLO|mmetsp:Transcript_8388/g.18967  ORF Transcript_8388/g.18967 Transcript_8388/m.18967 type:complete len:828 (+) Transcript_8388:789-3272(+)